MKKITLLVSLFIVSLAASAKVWIVSSSNFGNAFTPATITISSGDSVNFVLTNSHNAQEVSQATWNANGNTVLSGGFFVGFGGGLALPAKLTVGTHYYVCDPHASSGMKGMIIVQTTTGLETLAASDKSFTVFPGIATEKLNFRYNISQNDHVDIMLRDLLGNVVAVVVSENATSGDYHQTYIIDRNRIAPGIYVAEIITNGSRSQQKIIVQ